MLWTFDVEILMDYGWFFIQWSTLDGTSIDSKGSLLWNGLFNSHLPGFLNVSEEQQSHDKQTPLPWFLAARHPNLAIQKRPLSSAKWWKQLRQSLKNCPKKWSQYPCFKTGFLETRWWKIQTTMSQHWKLPIHAIHVCLHKIADGNQFLGKLIATKLLTNISNSKICTLQQTSIITAASANQACNANKVL